jgi:succinate dehydrogenase flavin-adding protein (antitoxin of CptAB toxin-antitoxin module)
VQLIQSENVVMDQLVEQLDAEIMQLLLANKDVILNLYQVHVIADKQQLENVEMDQLVDQPDVEIMLELLANKDVQDLLHLNQ